MVSTIRPHSTQCRQETELSVGSKDASTLFSGEDAILAAFSGVLSTYKKVLSTIYQACESSRQITRHESQPSLRNNSPQPYITVIIEVNKCDMLNDIEILEGSTPFVLDDQIPPKRRRT